jgi:hypothetical protein
MPRIPAMDSVPPREVLFSSEPGALPRHNPDAASILFLAAALARPLPIHARSMTEVQQFCRSLPREAASAKGYFSIVFFWRMAMR